VQEKERAFENCHSGHQKGASVRYRHAPDGSLPESAARHRQPSRDSGRQSHRSTEVGAHPAIWQFREGGADNHRRDERGCQPEISELPRRPDPGALEKLSTVNLSPPCDDQASGHVYHPLSAIWGVAMKFQWLVGIVFGVAFFSAPAAAESQGGRWKFAIAAGVSDFDIDVKPFADMYDDPEPTSAESRSDAFSLHASFLITRHFSVQGSYTDFGSVDYAKKQQCTRPGWVCSTEFRPPIIGNFRARALGLVAIGTLPLSPQFDIFAGAGASYVSYRSSGSAGQPSEFGYYELDTNSHKWRPTLELGSNWRFNDRWSAQLALQGIHDVSDGSLTRGANLYSAMLGIACHFGGG
jgi:hypothetical protein